ncbi:unnamed protein product [Rotaria magnacalcarata]|uniref:Uncharacterized protein n=3 Tax=Rotaria magnacalcarata TaxID=392030 RepID=A0A816P5R6_9BILA|nr:unnamed protein product [Rotaria magnacalcarata]CAF2180108.1 unnamed protein product [Rotaria magnacalcarata]CAF3817138.1 unnamed protein product [Rotaria magnacalcarata]CAF3989250.1 unnamed protein product [Rotaria magnacalcarata]
MFSKLQIAELRSPKIVQPILLNLSGVDHQTLYNLDELNAHVSTHSKLWSFILLLDLNDQFSDVDMDYLKRHHRVLAIFICVKPNSNIRFDGANVFPVYKELISYRIKLCAIRFFEDCSKAFLASNEIHAGLALKVRANFLKQQRFTSQQIQACHVLIIPLNTTDSNTYDYQQRLLESCYRLCGEYEPSVCTIHDYLPSYINSDFYKSEDANILCNYVTGICPIRIYLVGNEICIPDSMCKYAFEHELHNTNRFQDHDTYRIVKNEPISASVQLDLRKILNIGEQLVNVIIQEYHDIENDIEFATALEHSNSNLRGREKSTNMKLQESVASSSESPFEFSAAFRIIKQAQDGAKNHDDDDAGDRDINTEIQC